MNWYALVKCHILFYFYELNKKFGQLDKNVLIAVLILLLKGMAFMFCFSSTISRNRSFYGTNTIIIQHAIRVILTIISLLYFSLCSKKNLEKNIIAGTVISFFLLLCTLFISTPVNNARRWIKIPFFNLQPSCFILCFFPFCNAILIKKKKMKKSLLMLCLLCLILILQPDFGSAVIIVSTWLVQHIYNGSIFLYVPYLLFAIILCIPLVIFFGRHLIYRLVSHFSKNQSWNQVFLAINSIKKGGWTGAENISYIPDMHNDFFFAGFCNMLGITGGLIIISLLTYIFYRILICNRLKLNNIENSTVIGITTALMVQCLLHLMSNVAIIPPKGISLPFLSFGGTLLIANGIMIGIILNICRK